MFIYEVGYSSYEESPSIILVHEKEFSQEGFIDLIKDVLPDVVRENIEERNCTEWDWSSKAGTAYNARFENFYTPLANALCEKHGFFKANISASFMPFGWASAIDISDWGGHRDSSETAMVEYLNSLGITRDKYPSEDDLTLKTPEAMSEELRKIFYEPDGTLRISEK